MPLTVRLCVLVLTLLLALAAQASGFAYGEGFSPRLRATEQLAVVELTPTTADVALYFALDGIPAGKTLTYIIPSWYPAEGLSVQEEDLATFRKTRVQPAYEKVMRLQRINGGHTSMAFRDMALALATCGAAALRPRAWLPFARLDGAPLAAAAGQSTPSARVQQFRLAEMRNMRLLIGESGLPRKYARFLNKYPTPYYAVITLTGLPATQRDDTVARGVLCHFRHRIQRGIYTFPLGTGGVWPTPIPLTEVYLTCPEAYVLDIDAPVQGEQLADLASFRQQGLLGLLPARRDAWLRAATPADRARHQRPLTASFLTHPLPSHSAWHIAYANSNAGTDLFIAVKPHTKSWRMPVAAFLARPGVTQAFAALLYLGAWAIGAAVIIRRRWRKAGCPGRYWGHVGRSFLTAHLSGLLVALVFGGAFALVTHTVATQLAISIMAAAFAVIAVGLLTAYAIRYAHRESDWRKWMTLSCWLVSLAAYALFAYDGYWLLRWLETV